MIELAGTAPGDEDTIAALCAERDESYGYTLQATPANPGRRSAPRCSVTRR